MCPFPTTSKRVVKGAAASVDRMKAKVPLKNPSKVAVESTSYSFTQNYLH